MFGTVPIVSGQVDATSVIDVTCNPGTAYSIAIDDGQHAQGTQRRMQSEATFLGLFRVVNYEIYRNAGRSQRWGQTAGTTVNGVIPASGKAQHTIYGRVPNSVVLPAPYIDTLTVTLNF